MSFWASSLPPFSLAQNASPDAKVAVGLNKGFTKILIYIELRMV